MIDLSAIKASVLEEVFAANLTETVKTDTLKNPMQDVKKELQILYPDLKEYSLGETILPRDESIPNHTVLLFTGNFANPLSAKDKIILKKWIKQRTHADKLKLILE